LVHPSATYKPCESNLTKHFHIIWVSPCFQEVFVFFSGKCLVSWAGSCQPIHVKGVPCPWSRFPLPWDGHSKNISNFDEERKFFFSWVAEDA
jgi:hypothetical protein